MAELIVRDGVHHAMANFVVARNDVVDCLPIGSQRDPRESYRSYTAEHIEEQDDGPDLLYLTVYKYIGDDCRDVTGGNSSAIDWSKNVALTHYNNIRKWVRDHPDQFMERSDHDPVVVQLHQQEQQQQEQQQVQNTRETRPQQPAMHAPNNNRLNQQVQNLRAELEAKNERIRELEERNRELEDQLQSQKADTARCQRRLQLAEARQAGPRHRGLEEHEEDEEDEDEEEDHFIASGGDDDDADDDAGGASAAVGVGDAPAQKRRRGRRLQEEEKKDDEADGSDDSEEEEDQQQRTRRGRNGRGGKKKKTGEDDTDSGPQQDDQVPGGGGQISFTREEFEAKLETELEAKLETMQARLMAQLRAELAGASAADAAAAATAAANDASFAHHVEEQDDDISTERPAAAVAAVGGEPILGGNTLPQSISTGATAAGALPLLPAPMRTDAIKGDMKRASPILLVPLIRRSRVMMTPMASVEASADRSVPRLT